MSTSYLKSHIKKCIIWGLRRFLNEIDTKKAWYFIVKRKRLNLKDPKNLSDKICWLGFFDDNERMVDLSDKFEVRNYITSQGLEDILVPLYGVYNDVDDIALEEFPKEFVLKCTHGSGYNIICEDKQCLDWTRSKKQLNNWMQTKFGDYGIEPHYNKIKPRIICEHFLKKNMIDYKIHCFNGTPMFTLVCFDREKGLKLICYDNGWEKLDYIIGNMKTSVDIPKPKRFDEMLEISRKLSQPFTFVRVDLYEVDDMIYFGELTFTPNMGLFTYFNQDMLDHYGAVLKLPQR